jgi:Zn-dependent M28 family amino/carboxypeptidase
VVFLLTTGEEEGLLGTRWHLDHPRLPLERTVAQFEVEMVGRPDPAVGGAGRAWLTGYERSEMGERLAAAGVPLVADPRPEQRFFQRSDNIVFACRGIPAHTLSSFGLHAEYHTPDDEVERIDFPHLVRVIESGIAAVRLLADGAAPAWKPGGNPQGDPAICGRL